MVAALIQFLLSSGVIVVSGVYLTRNADKIAETTKLGRLLVGGIFLASATSLPELFVDISAVKNNIPDLAVGDLMGSSLFNLLILAIADLLHRGASTLFSRASAMHALSASMSISVMALAGMFILAGPQLASYAVGECGLGALGIVIAYILGLRMLYFDQKMRTKKSDGPVSRETRCFANNIPGLWKSSFGVFL